MKASEALILGSTMVPQGFGGHSIMDGTKPCALGTIALVTGILAFSNITNIYSNLRRGFPFLGVEAACPACRYGDKPTPYNNTVDEITWHLNDTHKWTRPQIAEWLKQYEVDQPEVKLPSIPRERALVAV